MRGLRIALGLVGVLCVSATAVAAEPGFYVGGGVGLYNAQVDTPLAGFTNSQLASVGVNCLVSPTGPNACLRNYSNSAAVWTVMGGWQINKWLAVQADYDWYDKGQSQIPINSSRNFTVDGEAWELSVKPSLALGEHFDLYARLGWNWYTFDGKYQFIQGQSESDDAAMAAGGISFNATPSFSIEAEYKYVDVDSGALDSATIRAVYRFKR
jgi:opacity protein-like surface antigen